MDVHGLQHGCREARGVLSFRAGVDVFGGQCQITAQERDPSQETPGQRDREEQPTADRRVECAVEVPVGLVQVVGDHECLHRCPDRGAVRAEPVAGQRPPGQRHDIVGRLAGDHRFHGQLGALHGRRPVRHVQERREMVQQLRPGADVGAGDADQFADQFRGQFVGHAGREFLGRQSEQFDGFGRGTERVAQPGQAVCRQRPLGGCVRKGQCLAQVGLGGLRLENVHLAVAQQPVHLGAQLRRWGFVAGPRQVHGGVAGRTLLPRLGRRGHQDGDAGDVAVRDGVQQV